MKWIINADDFGLNQNCTQAIIDAYRQKLITDTTIMANGEAFDQAVIAIQNGIAPPVGIHLNLTEGKALTEDMAKDSYFCNREGYFHKQWNRNKPMSKQHRKHIEAELQAQISKCIEFGINLTHADSHHHIHTGLALRRTVLRVLKKNGIKKLRIQRNVGSFNVLKKVMIPILNCALNKYGFTTTAMFGSADDYKGCYKDKIAEVMVHPAYNKDNNLVDTKSGWDIHGEILSNVLTFINSRDQRLSYKELK